MTDIELRKITLEAAIAIFHGDPATREFFENECETDKSLRTDAPCAMAQILVKVARSMEPVFKSYLEPDKEKPLSYII
jgi:hypothetical protein